MKWTVFLVLLLLSACAIQRRTATDEPAIPAAGKRIPKLYAPAVHAKPVLNPTRSTLHPDVIDEGSTYAATEAGRQQATPARPAIPYAPVTSSLEPRIVYLRDTLMLDSLQRELQIEQLANQAIRGRLKTTQSERDYWHDKNEQKFWALIAMGIFAFLYILFRVLAARIKET